MEKKYLFEVQNIKQIQLEDYPEDEFVIARMDFLGSNPNAHGLNISNKVFKECASSVLGKFVVAEISFGDCAGHTSRENIQGYVPTNQEVNFIETEEGYLRGIVDVVVSKQYSKDFVDLFTEGKQKSVSVEMVVTMEENSDEVLSFRIFGITVLSDKLSPSSPGSNIEFIRFSEQEANAFFEKLYLKENPMTLQNFVQERRKFMAESKTYKVDKSKEAMSTKSWGEVDKTDLRNKILEAKNKVSLVKDVYMLVESGWEEAPSEHLKYPVMCFEGDTLVYNRDGLSSALGYAKKENETAVVTKVEKIYKKLELDSEGKEENKKMSEIKFAAVDIGDMWGKLFDALHSKYPDGDWGSVYRIDGIYEEGNKKFAIIRHRDEDARYRLDFSFTEEGITLADEIVKVELEIKETDEVRKFSEPEDSDKFKKFEDEDDSDDKPKEEDDDDDDDDKKEHEKEMSCEQMKAKMAEMQADIESRDNIIMEKDKEIEELKLFKTGIEDKEKAMAVEATMMEAEKEKCFDSVQFAELREEGLACSMSELDAWKNKVKAACFDATKGIEKPKKDEVLSGIWSFSAPVVNKGHKGLWD